MASAPRAHALRCSQPSQSCSFRSKFDANFCGCKLCTSVYVCTSTRTHAHTHTRMHVRSARLLNRCPRKSFCAVELKRCLGRSRNFRGGIVLRGGVGERVSAARTLARRRRAEAAQVDRCPRTHRVVVPLLSMQNSVLLCISTLLDGGNHYSEPPAPPAPARACPRLPAPARVNPRRARAGKMINLTNPDGSKVFKSISITLVCGLWACLERTCEARCARLTERGRGRPLPPPHLRPLAPCLQTNA